MPGRLVQKFFTLGQAAYYVLIDGSLKGGKRVQTFHQL